MDMPKRARTTSAFVFNRDGIEPGYGYKGSNSKTKNAPRCWKCWGTPDWVSQRGTFYCYDCYSKSMVSGGRISCPDCKRTLFWRGPGPMVKAQMGERAPPSGFGQSKGCQRQSGNC